MLDREIILIINIILYYGGKPGDSFLEYAPPPSAVSHLFISNIFFQTEQGGEEVQLLITNQDFPALAPHCHPTDCDMKYFLLLVITCPGWTDDVILPARKDLSYQDIPEIIKQSPHAGRKKS